MKPLDTNEKRRLLTKTKFVSYGTAVLLAVVILILVSLTLYGGWTALLSVPLLLFCFVALLVLFLLIRTTVWLLQQPQSQVTQTGRWHYFIDL